jgi:Domain of unknown function (DUF4124)
MTSSRFHALRHGRPVLLAALLGLAVALPAAAQWKWRDQTGRTQYSDLPPPAGTAEKDILQRPSTTSSRAAARAPVVAASAASAASAAPLVAARASDPELEARRKKAEQDVLDKKKAEDAKLASNRADNCARAREQMRTIDSGMRMARTNAKGEREVLDDSARAAEAARTRGVIASECR